MEYGEKRSGVKIGVKKIRGSAAEGPHTLKAKRRLTLQKAVDGTGYKTMEATRLTSVSEPEQRKIGKKWEACPAGGWDCALLHVANF